MAFQDKLPGGFPGFLGSNGGCFSAIVDTQILGALQFFKAQTSFIRKKKNEVCVYVLFRSSELTWEYGVSLLGLHPEGDMKI